MDRKNLFLGLGCVSLALFLYILNAPKPTPVVPGAPKVVESGSAIPGKVPAPVVPVAPTVGAAGGIAINPADAKRVSLENGFIKVTFTSRGGAIEKVELLKQFADTERKTKVVFNDNNPEAALALGVRNALTNKVEPVYSEFVANVDEKARAVTFTGKLLDGTRVIRRFSLKEGEEDYAIRFSTMVVPPAAGVAASRVWHSTGCWGFTTGDSANQYISVLAHDGDDLTRVGTDVFKDSSGFFGLGAHKAEAEHPAAAVGKPYQWVSSGNQFFASIIHVDANSRGTRAELLARPVEFTKDTHGIQAFAYWDSPVAGDASVTTEGSFFVGPKEYARVAALPDSQVAVLQFSKILGFISFGAICKLLLFCLGGVHALMAWTGGWSWGWAIVILTVLIKVLTWPLTAAQQRSALKMQQFAGPMKDLREKYKDNSEKLNKEMMELYKKHKINPFAGCLPIFIQIPVFFGLYTAFQTTVELRLESFLWIHDLAAPDTLFHIGSFGVNILPVLMGITMWISMRMTPNPSADETQKMIMYTMALVFPVICYSLPAALSLYMTVQNLLTIVQAKMTKVPTDVVVVESRPKKSKG
ncbi:MAG: YidC/Oxa1 family insertase periplasmic-domain containing protein [Verrucomicrobia bacterium]|nr:YidC/Oxa1 family insertase periplasmic-domain containing protein [Verrucomicrobiota bacterium]